IQHRVTFKGLWITTVNYQAVLFIVYLLAKLQPVLLRQHLAPLRGRLEALLASGRAMSSEVRRRVRILRMPARPVDPKYFQTVCNATLSRKRLQLVYYSRSNDEETRRVVSPQRLVYY